MDPNQEKAAGDALREFLALIKTDEGRKRLATDPEDAIGKKIWDDLPQPLRDYLKDQNKNRLGLLNTVVNSFTPDGLLVIEEPSENVGHAGFATLCKF